MKSECMKLHVLSFGLALGAVKGLFLFMLSLLASLGGIGKGLVTTLGGFYIGYGATLGGAIVGLIIGFVAMFLFGIIVAWIYNYMLRYCCKEDK